MSVYSQHNNRCTVIRKREHLFLFSLALISILVHGKACGDVSVNRNISSTAMPDYPHQSLLSVEYLRTITNAVELIENIIERRCLLSVWLERWHVGSNSVDVINRVRISPESLKKEVHGWLGDAVEHPDELIIVLAEELHKESQRIETLMSGANMSIDDYFVRLNDGQRYRYLSRVYHCKDVLYATLRSKLVETESEKSSCILVPEQQNVDQTVKGKDGSLKSKETMKKMDKTTLVTP